MASMEVAERVAGTPQGSAAAGGATPALTRAEVAKHCTVDNCWVIIDYSVYDLTRFMDFHPGGSRAISLYAGKDITEVFYSLHKSSVLHKYGPKFFIGRLADAPPAPNALAEVGGPESELSNPGALSTVPYGEVPHLREGWHSPYYNDSHRSYRQNLREFLISELHDLTMSSDAANVLPPLDVLKKLGRMGLWAAKLGPGPHMKGMTIMGVRGKDFDLFHESITHEEFARIGAAGFQDGLCTGLVIGLPPVMQFAREDIRDRVTHECIQGDKVICLAISEPYAGSDVANIQTTATKTPDGKFYIVSGIKKWITNGTFSDYFVTAVRTGEAGIGGVSLLLIERSEGLITEKIPVSYGGSAGTALVILEDVKVPVENILGEENRGFQVIMGNFNHERWYIAATLQGAMRGIVDECFRWSSQRVVFGKKLISQPVIREKLARMVSKLEAHQAWLESLTYQMMMMNHMEAFMKLAGPIALLKMYSSRIAYELSDDAVQIFGGRAITLTGMGEHVERFQRAIKFGSILGGSEEIMADLAIRMASRYITPDARL